jgi:hypothetical protein
MVGQAQRSKETAAPAAVAGHLRQGSAGLHWWPRWVVLQPLLALLLLLAARQDLESRQHVFHCFAPCMAGRLCRKTAAASGHTANVGELPLNSVPVPVPPRRHMHTA